jgi:quercetin dioxygenase-like cupin family protein
MSEDHPVIDVGQGRDFHGLGVRVERLVHPRTLGSDRLGVSMAHMAPGERVKRHRHDYEEAYFVVQGEGVMYLEGVGDIELRPGRSVYVAPGRIHGQVNTSDDTELHILCSLSPPPVEGDVPELFE